MIDTLPPMFIIRRAEMVAARKPPGRCVNSLRGAVVYDPANGRVHGEGFNSPPEPLGCQRTDHCRKVCPKICEHAEGRAIRAAARAGIGALRVLHVKLGPDGRVVAGGPPSCWQCSRVALEVGFIAGVWLHELVKVPDPSAELAGSGVFVERGEWRFYPVLEFHELSLRNAGLA